MGNRMYEHEIVESVGIEMEFSNFDRESRALEDKMRKENMFEYRAVHDASCESFAKFFGNSDIPIEVENPKDLKILAPIIRRAKIGGEIVSPIRHSGTKEWINEIYKLVDIMKELGEDEKSVRDSFHVHVNVTQSIPLFSLKNLLKITLSLEAILFRLGGMGRVNRGEQNNYCFSRPFLGNGPPVVLQKWGNNKVSPIPICLPEEMLAAESKEEFFGRFGDSTFYAQHNTRYVTQRYMCVNFYPILTQGSFEFRTANKTLNPDYIIAWTNLCKALVEKAFTCRTEESLDQIQRPLAENREIPDDELMAALSYYSKLDEDTIEVLLDIWHKSPTPTFDNLWRITHLREPTMYQNKEYAPKSLGADIKIEDATFIDIHHLEHNNVLENVGFGNGILGRFNPRLRFPPNNPGVLGRIISIGRDVKSIVNDINVADMWEDWKCAWRTNAVDFYFFRIPDSFDVVIRVSFNDDDEGERTQEYIFRDIERINLPMIEDQILDGFPLNEVDLF